MKRPTIKSENAAAKPSHSRPDAPHRVALEHDLDGIHGRDAGVSESQIGPGHPLHRKKLYVSAVNKDADAWYVEGEKEDFYAIVYFGRKKRYGGKVHAQVRNSPGLGRRAATVCCGSQGSDEQAVVLATIHLGRVNFIEPYACAS